MPDEKDLTQGGQENPDAGKTVTTGGTEIDWSTVVIPDEVLKGTKAYKELLNESVARRQRIAELKAALEDDGNKEPVKKEEPVKKDSSNDDVPAWAKGLMDTISKLEGELGASKREAMVKEAITEYKLNPNVAELITGNDADSIKASAKKLSELIQTYPNIGATNPANPVDASKDMLKRVWAHMSGEGQANPFDPGLQSNLGGGAFRINK